LSDAALAKHIKRLLKSEIIRGEISPQNRRVIIYSLREDAQDTRDLQIIVTSKELYNIYKNTLPGFIPEVLGSLILSVFSVYRDSPDDAFIIVERFLEKVFADSVELETAEDAISNFCELISSIKSMSADALLKYATLIDNLSATRG